MPNKQLYLRASTNNNGLENKNSSDPSISKRVLFNRGKQSHEAFPLNHDEDSIHSAKDDLNVKPVLGKPSIESSMTIDWKNAEQKRHFLMNPCPKNGMTEFYIKRRKGIVNLLTPEYRVYLRTGHVFLMSSKKRPNKPTSNYLISMNYDQLKGSTGILGKLRANFLGSEYQIFDSGRNPKRVDLYFEETNVEDPTRYELGAILYGTQLLRTGEPRSMKVCIGKVMDDENKMSKKWQPAHKDEEMIRCFKHQSVSAKRHLHAFTSKCHPKDADQEEILRNFQGRVTLSSVKNFQLVGEEDGKLVMQFGRVDKDEFIMDVRWPMSPFQAFAIALSACDTKIACGD